MNKLVVSGNSSEGAESDISSNIDNSGSDVEFESEHESESD